MNIVTKFPGPEDLIGTFRRLSSAGEVYQILRVLRQLGNNDVMMEVKLVKSGEEVEYLYTNILDDPQEE